MSYDLSFNREAPLTEADVLEYLSGRRNYTTSVRSHDALGRFIEAMYQNPETGVYFILSIWDQTKVADYEEPSLASISLAFGRPNFFGMETGIEVGAFTKHFGLTVKDRQAGTDGPFSAEAFVKSWVISNQMTSGFFLSKASPAQKLYTRPPMELMHIWRWNYQLASIRANAIGKFVVPRIMWMLVDGELSSAVFWFKAAPAVIPAVEKVIIWRGDTPEPDMLSDQKELCIVSQPALDEYLSPLKTAQKGLAYRALYYPDVPENFRAFIERLEPEHGKIEFLGMDKVLDGARG